MTEFDKLNLRVLPVQDPSTKQPNLINEKTGKRIGVTWDQWCSWEEREEVYPGVNDWWVLPPCRSTFYENGVEIGYWVLDIDNHDGDNYKEAIKFLRSCNLPPSLTVRTPSGGLHIYYKALKDDIPAPLGRNQELNLPIEIKTSVGVVAPNGRNRVIIRDLPVAYFTISEDNPLSKIAKLKKERTHIVKKETNPDFPIEEEEFPEVVAGYRHATLMSTACSLYLRGCPPDKIEWWGREFYRRTGRKEQRNEISNVVRDAVNFIDEGNTETEELLEELKQEAEASEAPKQTFADIFPGAEELTGWDGVLAKSIFSDKTEVKKYISEELKNVSEEDKPIVRGLLTPSKMRETWASIPYEKQLQYEAFKDTVKMLVEKP